MEGEWFNADDFLNDELANNFDMGLSEDITDVNFKNEEMFNEQFTGFDTLDTNDDDAFEIESFSNEDEI